MRYDGSPWEALKRTGTPFDKHNPQFQVNGGRISCTWHEADGPEWRKARYQIWTAGMKVDGTGWQTTKRTASPLDKYTPQLQLHGERIYYVWEESDGKYSHIWTAVTRKDGTGGGAEQR